MKKIITLLLATALFAVSCGKKVEEAKQTMDAVNKLAEVGNKMEEYQKKAEAKLAERKKRGDIKAINFAELQKLLPAAPAGYKADEPKGTTMNMGETSFSQSTINFTKEGADGKTSRIKIEFFDYNENYAMYSGLAAWATADITIENSDGYEKNYNFGVNDVFAHEKWENKVKRGSLFVGAGFRFLINIEGENIDNTDILKELAKKMDLNKLAGM